MMELPSWSHSFWLNVPQVIKLIVQSQGRYRDQIPWKSRLSMETAIILSKVEESKTLSSRYADAYMYAIVEKPQATANANANTNCETQKRGISKAKYVPSPLRAEENVIKKLQELPHKNANRFWKTPQAMLKPSFPFHLWGPEPVSHLGQPSH